MRLWNYRDDLVYVSLEVLVASSHGANVVSVGVLHGEGVMLGFLCTPPVLRLAENAFTISTEEPMMYVLHVVVGKTVEPERAIHANGDARIWHRMMGH